MSFTINELRRRNASGRDVFRCDLNKVLCAGAYPKHPHRMIPQAHLHYNERLPNGATLEITYSGDSTYAAEIIRAVRERQKGVQSDLGSGLAWQILRRLLFLVSWILTNKLS